VLQAVWGLTKQTLSGHEFAGVLARGDQKRGLRPSVLDHHVLDDPRLERCDIAGLAPGPTEPFHDRPVNALVRQELYAPVGPLHDISAECLVSPASSFSKMSSTVIRVPATRCSGGKLSETSRNERQL
jgi:hypothetical protein